MARYESVNGAWPEGTNDGRDLKPTPQEAMSGARRLYRFAMKRRFRGRVRLTSGQRYTWIRNGVLYVNPDETRRWSDSGGGWHEIVHGLSHHCAYALYRCKAHDARHAFLEKEMIRYVVNSGWLEGKLKRPEKPKVETKHLRRERVIRRMALWESKRKRAENALKKLRRQARYYEQHASA